MSSLYEADMLEDLYREQGMTHQEAIKYSFEEYDRRSN